MIKGTLFFDSFEGLLSTGWTTFLAQGLGLIALGILVLLMPQLLVAMVAATFFMLGILSIGVALKARSVVKQHRLWRHEYLYSEE
ncbi:MAG: hypothetical protein K1X83_12600 [Oligoflexia bacterium]|nr:hypothetical protein [Oligoflexia bacterium]